MFSIQFCETGKKICRNVDINFKQILFFPSIITYQFGIIWFPYVLLLVYDLLLIPILHLLLVDIHDIYEFWFEGRAAHKETIDVGLLSYKQNQNSIN